MKRVRICDAYFVEALTGIVNNKLGGSWEYVGPVDYLVYGHGRNTEVVKFYGSSTCDSVLEIY